MRSMVMGAALAAVMTCGLVGGVQRAEATAIIGGGPGLGAELDGGLSINFEFDPTNRIPGTGSISLSIESYVTGLQDTWNYKPQYVTGTFFQSSCGYECVYREANVLFSDIAITYYSSETNTTSVLNEDSLSITAISYDYFQDPQLSDVYFYNDVGTFDENDGILTVVPLPRSSLLFGASLIALGAFGYGMKRKTAS